MSDAMYGFATGFADGFTKSYSARLANEAAEKKDKIRFGAQAWLNEKSAYDATKAADTAIVNQAKAFIRTNNLPEASLMNIYDMISADYTPTMMLDTINAQGAKFEAPEVVTDARVTTTVDQQTDELIDMASTALNSPSSGNMPGVSVVDADGVNGDTSTAPKDNPFAKYAKEIQETVGADSDYFNQVLGGYTAPDRGPRMKFTPGSSTKKTENLSFEKQAVLAAMADPEWKTEDYSGNITLLAKYKAELSPDSTKKRVFETPKELALFNLMGSDAYTALKDDPMGQNALLQSLESSFSNKGTSTTYTAGNYASDLSKFKLMLGSDKPEEVAAAEEWFRTVKPVREEALKSVAALTKDPEEPDTFAIMYIADGGGTMMGTATKGEGGNYVLTDGTQIGKNSISNVTTIDMADARTKAVQAASTIYGGVSKAQISTSVAAQNLMRLDRMAFDNENVLKTVAGGGSSLISSFSNEMQGLVGLLGELQKKDPDQSQTSLLSGINTEVDSMLDGGKITDEVARAYKEFNAAIVRTIFATGKALGQSGNGFSNQDYQVISKSLVNANSYEAFSNNLRRLTNELYGTWDATAVDARKNGLIRNVMMMPGGKEIVGNSLMGVQEYYQSDDGSSQINVYEWSQGKAKPRANGAVIESGTQQDVSAGMPKEFLGKKVIVFIEKGADGKSTGVTRYERY
jgi:hypothetical protein